MGASDLTRGVDQGGPSRGCSLDERHPEAGRARPGWPVRLEHVLGGVGTWGEWVGPQGQAACWAAPV